jgi:DNA-directed RNA polymerase alpha subunit
MILLEKVAPADRATEAAPTDYTERLALLDTKITDLGWDKRTINCLLNADINTLGDLVKHTKYDLIRIPNLGRKTLAEITETLGYMRLELAR